MNIDGARPKGPSKWLVGCGIGLLVTAVLLIGGSFGMYYLIETVLEDGVEKNAVVTSTSSPNYDMWSTTYDNETPDMYECYTMYNMTNADEVRCCCCA